MTEGLTRRRQAGQSDSVDLGSGSGPSSRLGSAANQGNNTTGSSTGSGAMEGRGKIAFDKRDFENKEVGSDPKLTIMEEVLLLGLKDKAVC
jgi:Golgi phosphoprotein 3